MDSTQGVSFHRALYIEHRLREQLCAFYLFYREEIAREMLGVEDQMSRSYQREVFRALGVPS